VQEDVRLERDGERVRTTVVLTNRRVVFVEAALGFALADVREAKSRSAGFFGRGDTLLDVELRAPFETDAAVSAHATSLALVFCTATLRDRFHEELQQGMRRLALDAAAEAQRAQAALARQAFTTTNAGVSGIMRAQDHLHASVDRAVDSAFSDLETLMAHAKQMVAIAEQLAARDASAQDADDEQQRDELERFKLFGIASPVTRVSHGASFHRELARQLSDFLSEPLRSSRGVLALTDVFCLFNRARGTELVSPGDLLQACELLPDLGLPMRLHRFSSGILAVRSLQAAGQGLEAQVVALACRREGVTAVEVGLRLSISLLLANEFLRALEQEARLCRDGMRSDSLAFYPNIFAHSPDGQRALAALLSQSGVEPKPG